MHGRVFVIKHIENQRVELQASFGGLLLRLHGEQVHLDSFTVDNTLVAQNHCFIVYLLTDDLIFCLE